MCVLTIEKKNWCAPFYGVSGKGRGDGQGRRWKGGPVGGRLVGSEVVGW